MITHPQVLWENTVFGVKWERCSCGSPATGRGVTFCSFMAILGPVFCPNRPLAFKVMQISLLYNPWGPFPDCFVQVLAIKIRPSVNYIFPKLFEQDFRHFVEPEFRQNQIFVNFLNQIFDNRLNHIFCTRFWSKV